jgi:starch-binding outer membrane protein, SusD/RagB family
MKYLIKNLAIIVTVLISFASCKKTSLDVLNKNEPGFNVLNTEAGVLAFASGGVYIAGFGDETNNNVPSVSDQLGQGMMLIVTGFHESMGDNIFVPWGNNSFKFADNPQWFKLDDGTTVQNPVGAGQIAELRLRNDRSYGASNSFLPEWTYMYFLNNSCNILLQKLTENITFSGNAELKKKTLTAWAYWWKGYAYSRIGSMYIAGVITDVPNETNANFVDRNAIITEADNNFDKASAILAGLSSGGDYDVVMTNIIPGFIQVGHGQVPTPAMWISNINSLKARNLLMNKKIKDMVAADWASVLSLANAGIQQDDNVFTIRTYQDNSKSVVNKDGIPVGGTAGMYTVTQDGSTYFASERMIQDFKPGDKRFTNNFSMRSSPVVNIRGRGLGFGTRWYLENGGKGLPGVITYCTIIPYGTTEYYLACSYEENRLMIAEATINTGDINGGLAIIDEIRVLQGAGIAAVAGTGLTLVQAQEELRIERRIALYLRGLAFYDARRMGIVDDVSKGGGRTNAVVLSSSASGATIVNTHTLINYNYLNYWDVPKNELVFNQPAAGSAPVVSPQ